jgi:hypothetical protein
LAYLCETLVILAPMVKELEYLRMAFLVYKVIVNVWRLTRKDGVYWEEIGMPNTEYRWDEFCEEEVETLRPYGEVVKDSMKKCDTSLKLKL